MQKTLEMTPKSRKRSIFQKVTSYRTYICTFLLSCTDSIQDNDYSVMRHTYKLINNIFRLSNAENPRNDSKIRVWLKVEQENPNSEIFHISCIPEVSRKILFPPKMCPAGQFLPENSVPPDNFFRKKSSPLGKDCPPCTFEKLQALRL